MAFGTYLVGAPFVVHKMSVSPLRQYLEVFFLILPDNTVKS